MTRIAIPILGGAIWTGGVNYLVNLCRVITQSAGTPIEVVIIVPDAIEASTLAPFEGLSSVRVATIPGGVRIGSASQWVKCFLLGRDAGLEKWFDAEQVDLVFEAAGYFGWRSGRAVMTWVPDFQHRRLPHMFKPSIRWKRDIRFYAQIFSGRTILLSSADAERDCEHFFPASSKQMVVARFAIPPELPRSPADRVAAHYELPRRFFFCPNQFWIHKNHLGLIEALGILKSRNSDVVVVTSGNPMDIHHPDHFETVERRVAELGIESMLPRLGLIPYKDVGELMRLCSALVNPSLCEGWSTTVEEAKSLGVPLVLSSLPVHQEQAGDAAIYFNPESPAEIADALDAAWKRFSEPGSIERAEAAFEPAQDRVNEFATAFRRAADVALAKFASG